MVEGKRAMLESEERGRVEGRQRNLWHVTRNDIFTCSLEAYDTYTSTPSSYQVTQVSQQTDQKHLLILALVEEFTLLDGGGKEDSLCKYHWIAKVSSHATATSPKHNCLNTGH